MKQKNRKDYPQGKIKDLLFVIKQYYQQPIYIPNPIENTKEKEASEEKKTSTLPKPEKNGRTKNFWHSLTTSASNGTSFLKGLLGKKIRDEVFLEDKITSSIRTTKTHELKIIQRQLEERIESHIKKTSTIIIPFHFIESRKVIVQKGNSKNYFQVFASTNQWNRFDPAVFSGLIVSFPKKNNPKFPAPIFIIFYPEHNLRNNWNKKNKKFPMHITNKGGATETVEGFLKSTIKEMYKNAIIIDIPNSDNNITSIGTHPNVEKHWTEKCFYAFEAKRFDFQEKQKPYRGNSVEDQAKKTLETIKADMPRNVYEHNYTLEEAFCSRPISTQQFPLFVKKELPSDPSPLEMRVFLFRDINKRWCAILIYVCGNTKAIHFGSPRLHSELQNKYGKTNVTNLTPLLANLLVKNNTSSGAIIVEAIDIIFRAVRSYNGERTISRVIENNIRILSNRSCQAIRIQHNIMLLKNFLKLKRKDLSSDSERKKSLVAELDYHLRKSMQIERYHIQESPKKEIKKQKIKKPKRKPYFQILPENCELSERLETPQINSHEINKELDKSLAFLSENASHKSSFTPITIYQHITKTWQTLLQSITKNFSAPLLLRIMQYTFIKLSLLNSPFSPDFMLRTTIRLLAKRIKQESYVFLPENSIFNQFMILNQEIEEMLNFLLKAPVARSDLEKLQSRIREKIFGDILGIRQDTLLNPSRICRNLEEFTTYFANKEEDEDSCASAFFDDQCHLTLRSPESLRLSKNILRAIKKLYYISCADKHILAPLKQLDILANLICPSLQQIKCKKNGKEFFQPKTITPSQITDLIINHSDLAHILFNCLSYELLQKRPMNSSSDDRIRTLLLSTHLYIKKQEKGFLTKQNKRIYKKMIIANHFRDYPIKFIDEDIDDYNSIRKQYGNDKGFYLCQKDENIFALVIHYDNKFNLLDLGPISEKLNKPKIRRSIVLRLNENRNDSPDNNTFEDYQIHYLNEEEEPSNKKGFYLRHKNGKIFTCVIHHEKTSDHFDLGHIKNFLNLHRFSVFIKNTLIEGRKNGLEDSIGNEIDFFDIHRADAKFCNEFEGEPALEKTENNGLVATINGDLIYTRLKEETSKIKEKWGNLEGFCKKIETLIPGIATKENLHKESEEEEEEGESDQDTQSSSSSCEEEEGETDGNDLFFTDEAVDEELDPDIFFPFEVHDPNKDETTKENESDENSSYASSSEEEEEGESSLEEGSDDAYDSDADGLVM